MKTINTTLALLFAGVILASAAPLVVTPVVTPTPPVRIAPMILSAGDAVPVLAQIKAEHNTVSLNGTTVTVFPPTGILITEGANAGKVMVNLVVRPATSPSPRP